MELELHSTFPLSPRRPGLCEMYASIFVGDYKNNFSGLASRFAAA